MAVAQVVELCHTVYMENNNLDYTSGELGYQRDEQRVHLIVYHLV